MFYEIVIYSFWTGLAFGIVGFTLWCLSRTDEAKQSAVNLFGTPSAFMFLISATFGVAIYLGKLLKGIL